MRLLSKALWIIAFVAATFCWMVLFEHGFSVEGFAKGVKEELGARWLQPELFRFGASSLLTDVERQLEHHAQGYYSASWRHALP